jgi:CubicO group peptidase (beta-lactamase class C family)
VSGAVDQARTAAGAATDAVGQAAGAATGAATGAAGAAGAAVQAATGAPSTDELVRRLFDPLAARLKAELRLDRERAGFVTDLRR